MNQKGFTLIEILGVLVILAVIFVLISPAVTSILSQSQDTVYQKQINSILSAAYDFSLKNIDYLPKYNEVNYLTLGELKYEGMIDVDIKNPNTEEKFEDNLVISIRNVGAGYKYSNKNSKLEGDYLYTVELDKLEDSSIISLLPKISLEGENLIENSDGNYITILDLNEEFTNIIVKSISSDGIDLTNKIKKYILLNDKAVDNIDSSEANIYKVNYIIVDDNGYANVSTLNVIIADTIPPIITLPKNVTLNSDEIFFDLMEGVSCTDNSNFCDIAPSGEIDYGVVGKYIITYTSTDPSGNTATEKRVITIE